MGSRRKKTTRAERDAQYNAVLRAAARARDAAALSAGRDSPRTINEALVPGEPPDTRRVAVTFAATAHTSAVGPVDIGDDPQAGRPAARRAASRPTTCQAVTRSGKPCPNRPTRGGYCRMHNKARANARGQRVDPDEYENYMRSPTWATRRAQFIATQRVVECPCGSTDDLHVHHITYERLGAEADDDLLLVCQRCHSRIHHLERVSPWLDVRAATAKVAAEGLAARQS